MTCSIIFFCSLYVFTYENQSIKLFNPYSTGIDFSDQNLTSVDVKILMSKVDPRAVKANIFIVTVDP